MDVLGLRPLYGPSEGVLHLLPLHSAPCLKTSKIVWIPVDDVDIGVEATPLATPFLAMGGSSSYSDPSTPPQFIELEKYTLLCFLVQLGGAAARRITATAAEADASDTSPCSHYLSTRLRRRPTKNKEIKKCA